MEITEWERKLSEAAKKRFPNQNWSTKDRLLSIQRQLGDVGLAVQCKEKIVDKKKCEKEDIKTPEHRVAALLADIFLLSNELGMDTNKELEEVLNWYEGGTICGNITSR